MKIKNLILDLISQNYTNKNIIKKIHNEGYYDTDIFNEFCDYGECLFGSIVMYEDDSMDIDEWTNITINQLRESYKV